MTKTVHGVIHGNTIELRENIGVADGQEVEVQVTFVGTKKKLPGLPPGWDPGSTKTVAGELADLATPEEDRLLDEIHQDHRRECGARSAS